MTTAECVSNEHSNGTARVAVQFLIYSETLSPEEIGKQLNLTPAKTVEKGVKFGKRTGTRVDVPRHMWQISSELHVSELDLGSHLDWILSTLNPIRAQLRALRDNGSIQCVLAGVVWTNVTSAHVQLAIHQMEMLIALQLELHLEFADYGEDD